MPVDLIPADLAAVDLDLLTVHTAESIVAVTLEAAVVEVVRTRIRERRPFALRGGGTAVVFLPFDDRASPAFDPNTGWVIPVTAEVAAEIDEVLRPMAGGYELNGTNLGFIVEEPSS